MNPVGQSVMVALITLAPAVLVIWLHLWSRHVDKRALQHHDSVVGRDGFVRF